MVHLVNILRTLIICLIFFTSIDGLSVANLPQKKTEDEKPLKNIIQMFIDEMESKYGLYCTGSGGRTREKIELISLTLATNRRASLEEAREIEVNAIERFLELLNSNEKIKPHLAKHPFLRTDLNISIMFVCKKTDDVFADGTICSVSNIHDNIYYRTQEITNDKFSNYFEESYENALQTVKAHPLHYDMRYHKEQGFEKEIDKLCINFVKKAHKKYGVQCENFGGKMVNGIEEVSFDFISNKKTSLERARKIEVELTQMFLDSINSNPHLKPFLKKYPFTAKQTPIRIHFYEKDELFFNDGSVSRMFQKDGRIHYFKEKPPTQWVDTWTDGDPILDETFEEAGLKLKEK